MIGSRRRFLSHALAGLAAVPLIEAGLATPAVAQSAGQSGEFVWAGVGGVWAQLVTDAFIKGSKFDGSTGGGSLKVSQSAQVETIAASKVLAACNRAPFAVSNHGQAEAALMAEAGCLQAYDPARQPQLGNIIPTARLGDRYAAFCLLSFGMLWNTKETAKPASFQDLLRPQYKGRIGLPAFGWYGMYWLHAVNNALGGTASDLSRGIDFIAKLVRDQDAVLFENNDHAVRLITAGDVVMAPFWSGGTNRMRKAGTPVAFEFVPGTIAVGSGFVIPASGADQTLAQEFVALTLDPERQVRFAVASQYPPTNRQAVLPPEHKDLALPPDAEQNFAKLDWAAINRTRDTTLELWNKRVL